MLRLLMLSLLLAAPATAQSPPPKKDRRVCRTSPDTGTRIAKPECHLASEWVAIDAERAAELEEMRRNQSGGASDRPVATQLPR